MGDYKDYKEGDLVIITSWGGRDSWGDHWFETGEILKLGGVYWKGSLEKHFGAISKIDPKGNGMEYAFELNYRIRHAEPNEQIYYKRYGIGSNINNMGGTIPTALEKKEIDLFNEGLDETDNEIGIHALPYPDEVCWELELLVKRNAYENGKAITLPVGYKTWIRNSMVDFSSSGFKIENNRFYCGFLKDDFKIISYGKSPTSSVFIEKKKYSDVITWGADDWENVPDRFLNRDNTRIKLDIGVNITKPNPIKPNIILNYRKRKQI